MIKDARGSTCIDDHGSTYMDVSTETTDVHVSTCLDVSTESMGVHRITCTDISTGKAVVCGSMCVYGR